MDLQRLRAARAAAADEMDQIVKTAAVQGRELTAEETTRFDELEAKVKSIKATIDRAEASAAVQADLEAARPAAAQRAGAADFARGVRGAEPKTEFESFGEFLHAVRYNPNDQRLEYKSMEMKEGSSGGFAVPTQFRGELLEVTPQQAMIRPRATVVPAGDPPDSKVTMPALGQGADSNMYGGVAVKWLEEGGTIPGSDGKLRQVSLEPKPIAGFVPVSNRLLANWGAAGPTLQRLLRGALFAAEDTAFYTGDGVGKPLGILKSPATIGVNRSAANNVVTADVEAMIAKSKLGGSQVFAASQSLMQKVMALKDDAGNRIWIPSARDGEPDRLYGRPIFWFERSPQIGTFGDLVLMDPSYFLIKDGSGPVVAISEHVKFLEDQTLIKIIWNVDGQSWLKEPITQEGGYQVSPFVALDVPAG